MADDNTNSSIKVKTSSFDKTKALKLIDDLTAIGFWSINNDSLNIRELKPKIPSKNLINNYSVVIVADQVRNFRVADGVTYKFEIIKDNKLKIFSCEAPESYLQTFPEIQTTRIFFKGKTLFERAVQ